ncbi:MAG: glycosyltransferase family 2 protein [Eubacteriales bacterium]
MDNQPKNIDYEEAYRKEKKKNSLLAFHMAILEDRNEEIEDKLNRIHNNIIWKASKPIRYFLSHTKHNIRRVMNCGGIAGIKAKTAYKIREKCAVKQYGIASFPKEEDRKYQSDYEFQRKVKISILVPLYNTPERFLREMIQSVLNQTYEYWELCLADGSDENFSYVKTVCEEYVQKEKKQRILYKKLEKNEGIAGNTNRCYEMATGEYIGLFDHDDLLHPSTLFEYVRAINEQGADYLYCDETTFKGNHIDKIVTMHFKPDFAIDNLRANNYICHFSVFARELLDGTELFRSRFDGSQDHDMILRLTARANKVVHIPKVLYYWRSHKQSVASGIQAKTYAIQAAKEAVADHLNKEGFEEFRVHSTRAFETIFRIGYEVIGEPLITIVIPNKDHKEDLERCITSIIQETTYTRYEILIVENNSITEEIKEYYKQLLELYPSKIKIITYTGVFNYSAINNLGVEQADGDYILLLNNDTQVITINWIEELLMYAQRDDVGAVGAKLYYPDKTIQHAGVVIGLGAHGTAGHSHYKQPKQNLGYMGRLCYAQNVSAVTGACLLVKKEKFYEVGGLEEDLCISLNDVDFCLKLREKGYLNVFTPFAELYHYESISRGLDDQGEKAKRYQEESNYFRSKWKEVIEQGDPYYNENFSLERSDFSIKVTK